MTDKFQLSGNIDSIRNSPLHALTVLCHDTQDAR